MSIASQITALSNNISSAYSMINQRGGTVPAHKNAENMATAIATIPSGGATKDYGTVTIAPIIPSFTVTNPNNCTVTVTNANKLFDLLIQDDALPVIVSSNNYRMQMTFNYDSSTGKWSDGSLSEETAYTDSQLASNGVSVTVTNPASNASFGITATLAISQDTSSYTQVNVTSDIDFQSLAFVATIPDRQYIQSGYCYQSVTIGGQKYSRSSIVGYTFGPDAEDIPDYFLQYCPNINSAITFPSTVQHVGKKFMLYCLNFNSAITFQSQNTAVGSYFLQENRAFNQPISLTNTIGNEFLSRCASFNSAITFASGGTIGNYFLHYCTSYNRPTDISTVSTFGEEFLSNCTSFNSTVTLPSSLTSIPNGFLYYCSSYNQTTNIPSSVTEIGTYFLYHCSAFNQVLTLPANLTTIQSNFIAYCSSYNQTISFPASLTTIGDYFLAYCTSYNNEMVLPDTITSLGNYFMYNCTSYNQPVTLSKGMTKIPDFFMSYCTVFNSPITKVTSDYAITEIGNNFLFYSNAFAQVWDVQYNSNIKKIGNGYFGNGNSRAVPAFVNAGTMAEQMERVTKSVPWKLEEVGDNFMSGYPSNTIAFGFSANTYIDMKCVKKIGNHFMSYTTGGMAFRFRDLEEIGNYFFAKSTDQQEIVLPEGLTTIGTYFLATQTTTSGAFGANVTIPSTVTSIGGYFIYNYYKMGGKTVTVNCPYSVFGSAASNYILSVSSNTATTYTTGITIKGSQRSSWLSNLPNRTSSPYRKLIDGGA